MSVNSLYSALPDLPLNRAPVIHTTDPEQMRQAMMATYGALHFTADPEGFEGFGSFAQLDDLGIGFCRYAAPAVAEFGESDFARLQIALRGAGRTFSGSAGVEVDPHHWCVSSPGTPSRLEFGADYQQMFVRISASALNGTLEALLGVKPRGALAFAPRADRDQRGAQTLQRLAELFAEQIDPSRPPLPPLMLRELQNALVVSFLCVMRHNYSDRLDRDAPDAAPEYVRLAEDYIASAWDRAITIPELANLTNVGVRSLFKAFQKHRGYSPMAFAKAVRLDKARAMLLDGDPSRSVTSVAFACGFSNLGHFAHDYRRKHGELPSETLSRAR